MRPKRPAEIVARRRSARARTRSTPAEPEGGASRSRSTAAASQPSTSARANSASPGPNRHGLDGKPASRLRPARPEEFRDFPECGWLGEGEASKSREVDRRSPSRHDGSVRTRNLSFWRGVVLALSALVALAGLHWTGVAQPIAATETSDIRMRAEQGDAEAQTRLGRMYFTGEGVIEDRREAVRWFRLAAEQGDAEGQTYLGLMYADGWGVVEDDREAVRWFRLAAEQGAAAAQGELGRMYFHGRGRHRGPS